MTIYKTFITIEDPNQVILSNLPSQKGQRVRIVLVAEDDERIQVKNFAISSRKRSPCLELMKLQKKK